MKKQIYILLALFAAREGAPNGAIGIDAVQAAIPNFWANLALGALKANTVMANLVNRDYDNQVATKGDVVNIIKRGNLVANDKASGKQIQLQTPENSKLPVTLNKHKEVSWLIEDVASAKALTDAVNYVTDAAIRLGEEIDGDLLALYAQAGLEAGTAATAINVDSILDTREKMNVARCPSSGRVFVISPKDETALLKLEQFTNAQWDDANKVALQEATLGRKYGFTFVMDQLVKSTTAGSPAVKTTHNLAFHKDAFVLVTRPLPTPPAGSGAISSIVEQDGISIRVTSSYSQKDGGTLWTLDVLYGVATMRSETHSVHVKG